MMDFDQQEKQISGNRQTEFSCMVAYPQRLEYILLRLGKVNFSGKAINWLNFPGEQPIAGVRAHICKIRLG